MQKGSKSGGGQGLPDRAAEEQATTRGERGFERASRAEILYVHCLRFLSGPFYIVICCKQNGYKMVSTHTVSALIITNKWTRDPHGSL